MNAKEYIEQLAQGSGLTQEVKDSMLKAVTENEKFAKSLEEGVMLRSDYSRQSDALKKEGERTTKYYSDLVAWKADQDRLYAESLNGNGNGNNNGDYLTKKELEAFQKAQQEELNKRDQNYIGLLKVGMRLASQHVNEFHESLDTEALTKIAVDKSISIEQAYNEMVAPRRTEFQTAARVAEIAKAREEGAREFASKHKIPVDTSAREAEFGRLNFDHKTSAVQDYVPNSGQLSPTSTRNLRESFVEAYNTAPTGTSGT